jgi:hypothetical protein
MIDGIFTPDELEADQAGPAAELPAHDPAEQGGQDRARGPDGKFLPKEEAPVVETGAEAGEGEQKKGDGTVPQGALHAEREKRKGSDERAAKAEAELAQLKEQLGAIQKMREQVAARKPEAMPEADDPAALEHLRKRLEQTESQVTRVTQHMDDEALGAQELQQLGSFMAQSETRFRAEKPDYDEAIDHIVKARASELQLYGLNPHQIQQTISEEAAELIRSAVQQGRDPAELSYALAQARGYRPAQTQEKAQEQPKPSGGAALLDAIANAKDKSKSLGSGGGSSAKNLTAEAIAALNADEFEAIYSTPEGKAMIDAL